MSDPPDLTATRQVLHDLAARVVSPAQERVNGEIALQVTPDGFGTAPFADPAGTLVRVRVEGGDLVREHGDGTLTREPIGPPFDLAAARALYAWWALGEQCLRALDLQPGESVSPVILWPEHFDIAVFLTLADGASVNLGFSPGDGFSPRPYVYVGPWQPPAGEFWNAPFGAYRTDETVRTSADAAAFFTEALALLRER